MSDSQTPGNGDDAKALAFCQTYLAKHPEANYKEVRRQAWSEGLRVTRRTFSVANQEGSEAPAPDAAAPTGQADEPAADDGGSEAPAAPEPGRQSWNDLFPGEAPAGEPGADAPQDEAPAAEETPTETARRALGLLSSPAAADEPRQNAVEFMANYLREKPEASYKEVREAAEQSGYTVSSATFGRAQAIVGILDDAEDEKTPAETSPGQESATEAQRPSLRARRRGRDPALLLEEFIDHWEIASGERSQFRAKLAEMLKVVEHALEQK